MKTQLLITAITVNLLLTAFNLFSQSPCLPEGIEFTTQEQIDNFQVNYPGCTEIEGDVTIYGDDIVNLQGLNVLTSIGGDLLIEDNDALTSLTGLEGLNSIGGDLLIYSNDALTSLTGLESITNINGDLIIFSNGITSLTGLENLISIDGSLRLVAEYNLQGLNALQYLKKIGGSLSIGIIGLNPDVGGTSLQSLTGLEELDSIHGGLSICLNNVLTDITALNGLNYLGGGLLVGGNDSLSNLLGLEGLSSIGGHLEIFGNDALTNLTGLEGLSSIGGYLWICYNNALTNLTGLENIEASSIDDLYIFEDSSLSTCEVKSVCAYLANPNGDIEIYDNTTGCNSPEEVEEACETVSVNELFTSEYFTIYPNPLASTATIKYNVSRESPVSLEIFNICGQKIQTLVNDAQSWGEHSVVLNTYRLKPGIYFCTLKSAEGMQTKKLIKLE